MGLLGRKLKKCFAADVLVIPRYKTHPPKIRGWGTLRVIYTEAGLKIEC
jgi:hypothetical protein